MKLVLKDKASGLYCQKSRGWTAFLPQASDFATMSEAVQHARDNKFPDFVVALEFFGMNHAILLADCAGSRIEMPAAELASSTAI